MGKIKEKPKLPGKQYKMRNMLLIVYASIFKHKNYFKDGFNVLRSIETTYQPEEWNNYRQIKKFIHFAVPFCLTIRCAAKEPELGVAW